MDAANSWRCPKLSFAFCFYLHCLQYGEVHLLPRGFGFSPFTTACYHGLMDSRKMHRKMLPISAQGYGVVLRHPPDAPEAWFFPQGLQNNNNNNNNKIKQWRAHL